MTDPLVYLPAIAATGLAVSGILLLFGDRIRLPKGDATDRQCQDAALAFVRRYKRPGVEMANKLSKIVLDEGGNPTEAKP